MEAYAAAVRVVDRSRQQMVDIDNHCRQQNQQANLPVFPKENNRDDSRYKKMQYQMDDRYSPLIEEIRPSFFTTVGQMPPALQ
ncbi:hypothetical protein GP2143_11514 [marine gamma proteobacterium HTCC2143]|jgi:hypothetical protein|uniref:Uncharacterized protein n=1 Tax=marine gamma proteobacterium HTCC2143 TaxID=247633 RepID=A0YHF1_9GAMM|nr:hypothetical protein GP2143_11514 [marine gamma proteobacterium HTCC2143]